MKKMLCFMLLSVLLSSAVFAYETGPTFAPYDPFYGDYIGTFTTGGRDIPARAMVVAEKRKDEAFQYRVMIIELDGKHDRFVDSMHGYPDEGQVELKKDQWTGLIKDGKLTAQKENSSEKFTGEFTIRKGSTLGKAAPEGAKVLMPYSPGHPGNIDKWVNKNWKVVMDGISDGAIQVDGGDNKTVDYFGAIQLHLEFCNPYECYKFGQGRGNSGVYFHGLYEVQVLDSYGLMPGEGDCGSIYNNKVVDIPHVSVPPANWQAYDITFYPPLADPAGNIVPDSHATLSVIHNDVKVHDNVEVKKLQSVMNYREPTPRGPLILQDHTNDVRYRNIWYVELEDNRKAPDGFNFDTEAHLRKLDNILGNLRANNEDSLKELDSYIAIAKECIFMDIMGQIKERMLAYIASDGDQQARTKVSRILIDEADCEDIEGFTKFFIAKANSASASLIEDVVVAVTLKSSDRDVRSKGILQAIANTNDDKLQVTLLKMYKKLGAQVGRDTLLEVSKNGSKDAKIVAAEIFQNWHNTTPLDRLIEITARETDGNVHDAQAKACVRFASFPAPGSKAQKTALVGRVIAACRSGEAKTDALKMLTTYFCREALDLANSLKNDSNQAVAKAAENAYNDVSAKLLKTTFTATASHNNNEANRTLDSNFDTRWSVNRGMEPGMWYMIDFGKDLEISGVILDAVASADDFPRGYEVFISNDGKNFTGPIATGQGQKQTPTDISFGKNINTRFVKIVQTGQAGNNWAIHEFFIK